MGSRGDLGRRGKETKVELGIRAVHLVYTKGHSCPSANTEVGENRLEDAPWQESPLVVTVNPVEGKLVSSVIE